MGPRLPEGIGRIQPLGGNFNIASPVLGIILGVRSALSEVHSKCRHPNIVPTATNGCAQNVTGTEEYDRCEEHN